MQEPPLRDLQVDTDSAALGSLPAVWLDALSEGILVIDREGVVQFANDRARRLLRLHSVSGQEVVALDPDEPYHGSAEAFSVLIQELFLTGQALEEVTVKATSPQGATRWLVFTARPLEMGPDGAPWNALLLLRDAAEMVADRNHQKWQVGFRSGILRTLERLLGGEADSALYQYLLEVAVEVIPGAEAGNLIVADDDGSYRFEAAVGYDIELLGDVHLLQQELRRDRSHRGPQLIYGFDDGGMDFERRTALMAAGPVEEIDVRLSLPILVAGRVAGYLHLDNFQDATAFDNQQIEMALVFAAHAGLLWQRLQADGELQQRRADLERLSFHDALTGLPNRDLLRDRVEQALAHARRSDQPLALMFVNLDRFVQLNDALGNDVGDAVLVAVAQRLRTHFRESDTVARWNGDEFVVLLTNLARSEDAGPVAEKVLTVMREPLVVGGQDLQVTASIGIDVYPYQAEVADDLIRNASVALSRAKQSGKDCYRFFTDAMNDQQVQRRELLSELRHALDRNEFVIHYQPRVELASLRITGVEALVRWQHPRLGLVMPDVFIPTLEENGLMHLLGRLVLTLACRQVLDWQRSGHHLQVAINLSASQLKEASLAETVASILAGYRLDPDCLELEITERVAMDDVDRSMRTLRRLEELGVAVALDDFGTARSSLAYLTRLSLSSLKIDRSFVAALGDNPEQAADEAGTVRAVIALGQSLDLTLVAEGVETEAQYRLLKEFGCQQAQGHLFSRPLPPDELEKLLVAGTASLPAGPE